jgi:hypothetical protein
LKRNIYPCYFSLVFAFLFYDQGRKKGLASRAAARGRQPITGTVTYLKYWEIRCL